MDRVEKGWRVGGRREDRKEERGKAKVEKEGGDRRTDSGDRDGEQEDDGWEQEEDDGDGDWEEPHVKMKVNPPPKPTPKPSPAPKNGPVQTRLNFKAISPKKGVRRIREAGSTPEDRAKKAKGRGNSPAPTDPNNEELVREEQSGCTPTELFPPLQQDTTSPLEGDHGVKGGEKTDPLSSVLSPVHNKQTSDPSPTEGRGITEDGQQGSQDMDVSEDPKLKMSVSEGGVDRGH